MVRPPPPQYECVTDGVAVRVRPRFMFDESEPARHHYVWSYAVEVENLSDTAWRLVSRYWEIIDADGRRLIVEGDGVVGEQPLIAPGETYRYASGTPLGTPSGLMRGYYAMKSESGVGLKAQIPLFSLDSPYEQSQPS